MKMPFNNIGFRILLIGAWILLGLLFFQYPVDNLVFLVAVVIVAVVQGFIVKPWHFFDAGWKSLFYNLITFGGTYIISHVYMTITK